jgi:hypothetical protein
MARVELQHTGAPASEELYRRLETGDILYFPETPFPISADERAFLLSQKQSSAAYHKNISYRPGTGVLRGVDQKDATKRQRMLETMRAYADRAIAFMQSFLPRYARQWRLDFTSFRPLEEAGRNVALRSRNDLIHIDAFGSRPSHGDRLLRIFTNIHPRQPRVWVTSDPFETLAEQYANQVGLPSLSSPWRRARGSMLGLLGGIGIPVVNRPPYDQFMRRFHHFMKESEAFQRECRKDRWEFPPNSTWIVFTDTTSHSCVSGQYALEQTFIVHLASLAWPEKSPIAILERLAGFPLTAAGARSA